MSTFHVIAGGPRVSPTPQVRRIDLDDIRHAVTGGWQDFQAMRSDIFMAALIYPIVGFVLAYWSSGANVLPLLYPLVTGFALVGPLTAVGLYEISRRREAGLDASARHALDVFKSPSLPSIIALGIALALVFLLWLATAQALYQSLMHESVPTSLSAMVEEVLTTRNGLILLVVGNAVGFVFAALVFCATAISVPMLLDHDVGLAEAIRESFEAVYRNPLEMAAWAATIAAGLAIGFLTMFIGLAIVVPVLGHATWRLYRAIIGRAP